MKTAKASAKFLFTNIIYGIIFAILINGFVFLRKNILLIIAAVAVFVILNLTAGKKVLKPKSRWLKYCSHGSCLLFSFCVSATVSVIFHILMLTKIIQFETKAVVGSCIFCVVLNFILFWHGIICVYLTSLQLGGSLRVWGAVCGFIPVVNLVLLGNIISRTFREAVLETEREKLDLKRKDDRVCGTKYPLLMVHGVFFRDYKHMNYWGRIPGELEKNGARIFYANHQSARAVSKSAEEISQRIKEIVEQTGCGKVNIIAHSKGGLDCRYALSNCEIAPYVASVTTVNSPHRGCMFADWLLGKVPESMKNTIASTYNKAAKKLGDDEPDFMEAVQNLTSEYCEALSGVTSIPEGVFCQSFGSVLNKGSSGKFPMNMSYHFVKLFDGKNDGLVSESSFEWGERFTMIPSPDKRGVSHADVIDLNRENIQGFDVKEFYVSLVSDLKQRGF